MVNLPTCTGTSIAAAGFLTSADTYPLQVYGLVGMHSSSEFNLAYVSGSAILESNAGKAPVQIQSEAFLTSHGQLIGYKSLDGELRPGTSNTEIFSFEVRPQFAPIE